MIIVDILKILFVTVKANTIRNRTMIAQDMYIINRGTYKYMTYNNKQKTEKKTAVIIVRYCNMDRHELFPIIIMV
jgi:hypothetical protein